MVELGYLIAFIVGGSVGFVIACVLAANARGDLIWENVRLEKELDSYRNSLEKAQKDCPDVGLIREADEASSYFVA